MTPLVFLFLDIERTLIDVSCLLVEMWLACKRIMNVHAYCWR